MKRSIIRALVLMLMLITQIGGFAFDFECEGLRYNITYGGVEITYLYEDSKNRFYASGDLEIPKYVKHGGVTYTVTSIGKYAFWECSYLKSVKIPNSVKTIADDAFHHCVSLTSVSIPNSVTSIGWSAFANCPSLKSVIIPSSVKSLGPSAFSRCYSLENVSLSNSITSIGKNAFSNCCSLSSLTIPSTVTSIGEGAFRGCLSLKSINIPDKVTYLSRELFAGCSGLTYVTIPNSVTSIGWDAFSGCTGITSMTIPSSVTSIGRGAFSGCSSLTSVTIPNSVTSIGEYAFSWCTGLSTVTIPNTVTSIERCTFEGCVALSSVMIPNSVASIGEEAFSDCTHLKNIYVGNGNPYYSSVDGVLYNKSATTLICCPSGKETVSIPNTVKTIGSNAFVACSNLRNINVDSDNNSFASFDGALYNKDLSELISCPGGKVSVAIPKVTTALATLAFCSLLEDISVDPENPIFSSIDGVLYNKGITNLICCPRGKTSIKIPQTVTSISTTYGYPVFRGCSQLEDIQVESDNPEFSSIEGVLYNKDASNLIYCPEGKVFLSIPYTVTSISDFALYFCSILKSIEVDPRNSVYSSIDGILYNKGASILMLCPPGKTVVTIPDTSISISQDAFNECNSLTIFTIPPSPNLGYFDLPFNTNLRAIYCMQQDPNQSHIKLPWESMYHKCKLYVPIGTLVEYRRDLTWGAFHHIEEMDFSGIEDAEMDATRSADEPVIRVENGVIKVDNADGETPVEVFDISGKSVFRECANMVSGLVKGIYIVKVGDKVQKIRL